MSHPYRLTRPEELAAPGEMEPAVVLRVSLKAIASVVAEKVGEKRSNLIFHARDSDAMYLRVNGVPLIVVSCTEEPREAHVYVADPNVQGESGLLDLPGRLPLSGVKGDWWKRKDQPRWPGNSAGNFVIRRRGRGRRLWTGTSAPSPPDGDRLMALMQLIEQYEAPFMQEFRHASL